MPSYKSMYLRLFNRVTDAIALLQQAQIESEDIYVSSKDSPLIEVLNLQEYNEKELTSYCTGDSSPRLE